MGDRLGIPVRRRGSEVISPPRPPAPVRVPAVFGAAGAKANFQQFVTMEGGWWSGIGMPFYGFCRLARFVMNERQYNLHIYVALPALRITKTAERQAPGPSIRDAPAEKGPQ